MRLIGVIGGVTWVSTQDYYRNLNRLVAERLGGLHSARVVIYSIDFHELAEAQHRDDWDRVADITTDAGLALKAAGADLFLIGCNTVHLVHDQVAERVGLPSPHIVDAVGREAQRAGHRRLGLIGTRFTMEGPLYRERLARDFGLEVVIPDAPDREEIHRIIYQELSHEQVLESACRTGHAVAERLAARGAECLILGCTELPLLFRPARGKRQSPKRRTLPLVDPLELHCREAVELALAD